MRILKCLILAVEILKYLKLKNRNLDEIVDYFKEGSESPDSTDIALKYCTSYPQGWVIKEDDYYVLSECGKMRLSIFYRRRRTKLKKYEEEQKEECEKFKKKVYMPLWMENSTSGRIGQIEFRDELLRRFKNRCAISGISMKEVLEAVSPADQASKVGSKSPGTVSCIKSHWCTCTPI